MSEATCTVELYSWSDDPDWHLLAEHDPHAGLFAHPAFVRGFVESFSDRAAILTARLHDKRGTLLAVAPMMVTRHIRHAGLVPRYDYLTGDRDLMLDKPQRLIPLRQLSPVLGLECSNLRMASLRGTGLTQRSFWHALANGLCKTEGWDIGIFPIPSKEADAAVAAFRSAGCLPFIRESGRAYAVRRKPIAMKEMLAAQSAKFRQNIRRAERQAREAGVVLSVVSGREVIPLMAGFAALAARSWKEGSAEAAKAAGQKVLVRYKGAQRLFFERLVGDPTLTPVMATAHAGGEMEAACLSFLQGGGFTTMLTFHLPKRGKAAHGRLVFHAGLDWAFRNGACRLDYNSTAEWVRVYADALEPDLQVMVVRPGGLLGAVLAALARLKGAAAWPP